MSHRQVPLTPPETWPTDERTIYVDEGMRPLLREMWRCGLFTQFSCEGYDDEATIAGARWVLERLARITSGSTRPPGWRFERVDIGYDGCSLYDTCSLYFPKALVPEAAERVAKRAARLDGRPEIPAWPEQEPFDPVVITFAPGGAA